MIGKFEGNPDAWTKVQVVLFLESIGLEEYSPQFST